MDYDVEEKIVLKEKVEFSKSKVMSLWFVCLFIFLYSTSSINVVFKYMGRFDSVSSYIYLIATSVILCSVGIIISVVCIYFIFINVNKVVGWFLMVGSLLLKLSLLIIINGVFYILFKNSGIKSYDVMLSRASGGFIVLDALFLHYFMNKKVLRYFEVRFVNSILVRNMLMIACIGMGVLLFRV